MKCPSCQHENISDFPFCEDCLTLLPARPGNELAFELDIASADQPKAVAGWPPFQWNPAQLPNELVGREKILAELLSGWDTTVSSWTSRLHLLVSEFGMGKSQITSRLAREALIREPAARVVRIRCPERGGPFRLWDAVLRDLFDIPEVATSLEAGDFLRKGVARHLDDGADEVATVIADLLGYTISGRPRASDRDGEAILSRAVGALSRLFSAVATEPLLIIVAQANRGTSSSLALAGALEASLKDRPAMMLFTGTPELTHILPGWERFPSTHVGPLSKKAAQEIVKLFLTGLTNIPRELTERIVERAKGNPWAIKSMLHYLGEAGAIKIEGGRHVIDESICWDLEWPEDLEGVVLARLGMLSARDRSVLAIAAVVGPVFWSGAIVAIERRDVAEVATPGETVRDNLSWAVSRSLERLSALRFIRRQQTRLVGEEAWGFRSALHHQVASTIVPEATRGKLHSVIEQWLRVHAAHDDREYLIELARHSELSGERARAVLYHLRAARHALRDHNPGEAKTYLAQAENLVAVDDRPTRLDIAMIQGEAKSALGEFDDALSSFHKALHLAWQLRHRRRGADALVQLGKVESMAGRYDQAANHFEAGLRLYEERDDQRGVADVCLHMGKVYWLKGRHAEALQSYRKGEKTYEELADEKGLGDVTDAIATLHYDRGDLEQAEKFYRRAIRLKNAVDDPRGVAAGLCNLGATWHSQGQIEKSIKAWQEGLELASLIGSLSLQSMLGVNLGEAYMKLDRFDQATEYFDKALHWVRVGGEPRALAGIRLNRAAILMKSKKWPEAVAELESAGKVCEQLDIPRVRGQLERMTGELFLAKHDSRSDKTQQRHLKRSLQHLRESITHFVEAGCNLEAASTHERLADALELASKQEDADRERGIAKELRSAHNGTTEVTTSSTTALDELVRSGQ